MRTNCLHCDCPLLCLAGEKRSLCARCLAVKWKRARDKYTAKKPAKASKSERICKDCNQPFPSPSGRALRQCEACRKAHKSVKDKRYRDAHRQELNQKDKQRYQANSVQMRQLAKQYYELHREQVLARKRERERADRVSHTKLGMMR